MTQLTDATAEQLLQQWDKVVAKYDTAEERVQGALDAMTFIVSNPGTFLHGSTHFYLELISWMKLHGLKSRDYAGVAISPFFNFVEAARFAGITPLQQFDALIGTKVSRILNLRYLSEVPSNESMDDSYMDLGIYVGLRQAYLRSL